MSYLRFTKIIIDYFMLKDQSISRRNKMFWHTARDDTMFTSMRCISRHEDTQVYGTILSKELTNQAMLESKAYKTYYTFASGEKALKPKYVRKKADSNTSPKQKHVQATKGTRIKTKAKVGKFDKKKQPAKMPKAKGLDVLSKVALTEAEQLKLATKRSKTEFHSSHASGSDEGTGTILGVLNVPIYESKSEKESWGDSEEEDDNDDDGDSDDHNDDNQTEHEEEDVDDIVHTPSDYELTDDEKIDDEETMDDEEDDEVTKELYEDINVNLGNEDTEMADVDQDASEQQNVSQESVFEQVEEDTHVTLTSVLGTQKADEPVQSSFVSSHFTSKLLNFENPSPADNEIASLMETSASHAMAVPKIASGFTTPPPYFNHLPQQATPTPTPTTSKATTSFPSLLDFSSVFRFNDRVTNLEKDMSEINKVDQYAQALSFIPTIVDPVSDFSNPVIEKNITKSLEVAILTGSSSQLKSTYKEAASLSKFELTKILLDKIEESKSHLIVDYKKKLYYALVESYKIDKDLFDSYGEVYTLNRSRDDKDKDRDPSAGSDRGTKRRKSSKDVWLSRDSSDGTLDDVRSALNDISKGIRMEYLPKRKWNGLDKRRAQVMIQDINKQLYERSQNRRDLPRDIPLDSVVVLRYEKRSKSENKGKVPTEMELVLEQTLQEHPSDTYVFTVKMEILLEPTSNKLLVLEGPQNNFDILTSEPYVFSQAVQRGNGVGRDILNIIENDLKDTTEPQWLRLKCNGDKLFASSADGRQILFDSSSNKVRWSNPTGSGNPSQCMLFQSSMKNRSFEYLRTDGVREHSEPLCMTRSSTNELFTPYKEPEREFRSSRRHFKTLNLNELRSPDFNLLSDQE
ncbi:hypothetical protein Tco_0798059 [Tanacetum coccineum]